MDMDEENTIFEELIRNDWGLSEDTLNHLMRCGITMACLKVMKIEDINELFFDLTMLGQKILFKSGLEIWRLKNNIKDENLKQVSVQSSHHTSPPSTSEPSSSQSHKRQRLYSPIHILPSPSPHFEMPSPQQQVQMQQIDQSPHLYEPKYRNLWVPFDLETILYGNPKGRLVLESYAATNELDRKHQVTITHLIVDHFLYNGLEMRTKDMMHCAEAVVELFPTEKVETYLMTGGTGNNKIRGKIYDRYRNMRKTGRGYKARYRSPNKNMMHQNYSVDPEALEIEIKVEEGDSFDSQ